MCSLPWKLHDISYLGQLASFFFFEKARAVYTHTHTPALGINQPVYSGSILVVYLQGLSCILARITYNCWSPTISHVINFKLISANSFHKQTECCNWIDEIYLQFSEEKLKTQLIHLHLDLIRVGTYKFRHLICVRIAMDMYPYVRIHWFIA